MGKFLLGAVTAALWFALSHAANAERVCRQVCDHGACVSKCVDHPDADVTIHEHEHYRDESRGPGVDIHAPGVGVDIGH